MQGLFITFEGPEGSGKTTQAARLAVRLEECGREVVRAREPGGTATGEAIREILQHDGAGETPVPEAEVFLFAASRAQLVRRVILPALARGAWVVCDRFADSTTAYQGYGRGLDVERILGVNSLAIEDAAPDLTFLLDVDVATGFDRLWARNRKGGLQEDRFEREQRQFHERVRSGYLELAERWPERIRILDADRAEDRVHADIWRIVDEVRAEKEGCGTGDK